MDNLLLSASKFILEPESSFSNLFLIVFILCFIYGVWQVKSCIDNWNEFEANAKEEYAKLRDHFLPDTFIELKKEALAANENKITDLPNVLVTIGILGTFIGLGVSIQGAASLLNDENIDLSKLNAMLGVIAFKFQISVWGTISSLFFQKLVIGYYIEKKQQIIVKILRLLYENETAIRTTMENQLVVASETRDISTSQLNRLEKQLTLESETRNISEDQLHCLNSQITIASTANELAESRLKHMAFMQEHFRDYVKLAGTFAENVNQFSENVDIYHRNLLEAMQSSEKTLSSIEAEVTKQIVQERENVSEILNDVQKQIIESIEILQKVFVRSEDNYLKNAQEAFYGQLRETQEKVRLTYGKAAEKLDATVLKLSDKLDCVDSQMKTLHNEFIEEQGRFMANHNVTFSEIRSMMGAIGETEKEYRKRMIECYENMEKICQSMDNASRASAQEFKKFAEGVQKELSKLCDDTAKGRGDFKNSLVAFNDRLGEEAKVHMERMDDIRQVIGGILQENKRINQRLKDMPTSLMNFRISKG